MIQVEVRDLLIHEVSRCTQLTKKAVEYYVEKGLVVPKMQENGYRDFGKEDVEVLRRIGVLRKLGIGLGDIRRILEDDTGEALQKAAVRKELKTRRNVRRDALIRKLGDGTSYEEVWEELRALEIQENVGDRLLDAFPGFFGRFICMHFSGFLNDPVETKEQQEAYETVLSFLDHMPPVHMPEDAEEVMEENTKCLDTEQIGKMFDSVRRSVEEPEAFLEENRETVEWYLAYRQSEEYRNSAAGRWMECMREFQKASGYTEVFLPAMRRLSPSYAEYCRRMERANKLFLERYPEAEEL